MAHLLGVDEKGLDPRRLHPGQHLHQVVELPPDVVGQGRKAEAGRRAGAPRRAAIEINSLPGMLEAVRSGLGLTALPDYIGDQLDGLVQVLPEVKAPRIEAFFVYPEEMRHSKRVSVFRDFLVAELAATA
jgi:DNA-binding transcriptional LysR family regulator